MEDCRDVGKRSLKFHHGMHFLAKPVRGSLLECCTPPSCGKYNTKLSHGVAFLHLVVVVHCAPGGKEYSKQSQILSESGVMHSVGRVGSVHSIYEDMQITYHKIKILSM